LDTSVDRLPSLTALRAFEAAARHLSFTRAAIELNVTHGAVSRQVASLEEHLRALLFIRGPRELTLTDQGIRLARSVSAAFEMLRTASASVSPTAQAMSLRVSVPPTLAMWWLMPRLAAIHHTHPELRLDLSTSTDPANFKCDAYDVAIRRITQTPAGMTAMRFMDGRSMPVCSPGYRARLQIKSLEDLSRSTLIVSRSEPLAWPVWLKERGVTPGKTPDLTFDQLYFALQAALDSLGVALAPAALVESQVQAGRLVALATPHGARSSYALLSPRICVKPGPVRQLAEWLTLVSRDADA
jgi:LysR family glycine cleavage system transcriptional activator